MRVLLVEDSTAQARFIQQTLREVSSPTRFDVAWAPSLTEGLDHLGGAECDLVLLDLVLPDSEGIDTFTALRTAHPNLPVVVLSGAGDETTALQAVAQGAQDYLSKSTLSPELLTRSIRYAMERHRAVEELRRVALVDELTGAYNRRGFLLLAEQHMAVARRAGVPVIVLFVDVDGLKAINDTLGHDVGDRALADVAELMRATFRASDVVGRVGGDEFCALLTTQGTESETAVARLEAAIAAHNDTGARAFTLSCSIGAVSQEPAPGVRFADLLGRADREMYETKRAARRPVVLVVDDDPVTRKLCEEMLAGDFDVLTAESGTAGLEVAARQRPSVVLLDLGLPDVEGGKVLDELRSRPETSAIPVVVVTADTAESTELATYRAGGDAFVAKPVGDDALRRSIERALQRAGRR